MSSVSYKSSALHIQSTFEHAVIRSDDPNNRLKEGDFEYLQRIADDIKDTRPAVFSVKRQGRNWQASIRGYCGILRLPSGLILEVLPKIGRKNSSVETARKAIIRMLLTEPMFPSIPFAEALLNSCHKPLIELFFLEFLKELASVVRRGFNRTYVSQQENLGYLRGRLLISKHITSNLLHPERFYVEHEEFSIDRAENRLLKAALQIINSISLSAEISRVIEKLLFTMSDIPSSIDIKDDFQKCTHDRSVAHYKNALAWARLILTGQSLLPESGMNRSPGIFFDMNRLFEQFTGSVLSSSLNSGNRISRQGPRENFCLHRPEGRGEDLQLFQLKPDFLVFDHSKQPTLLLDAKWKLIDSDSLYPYKYYITQADLYQLFTYAHYYLGCTGDVILLYPLHEKFQRPLPVFQAKDLRFWVVPVDIEACRIILPSERLAEKIRTVFAASSA